MNCRVAQSVEGVHMANPTAKPDSSKSAKPRVVAVTSTAADSTAESTPKSGAKPNSLLASSVSPVTAETRLTMIAEAAYYIAEQRGFGFGREVDDCVDLLVEGGYFLIDRGIADVAPMQIMRVAHEALAVSSEHTAENHASRYASWLEST